MPSPRLTRTRPATEMRDYLISARRIRRGSFIAEPGQSRYLEVPADAVPNPSHAVSRKQFIDAVLDRARSSDTADDCAGDIAIFVHGFNTSVDELIERHRQFRDTLKAAGFDGALVSFDWPSDDIAINYLEDRVDAKLSAFRLVSDGIALLVRRQFRDCEFRLHVIAHSMGAFVVREAFDDADDRPGIAATNWTVSQICFVGADISSASMHARDARSRSLYRHCTRLTNYQNPYDRILKLSNVKRAGVAPRAGRRGLPDGAPQKAVNVNCAEHFAANYPGDNGHSWYFSDETFVRDLVTTLFGGLDRSVVADRRIDARGDIHLV